MGESAHTKVAPPTRQQLEKFIRIRNRSEFDSNLQFAFDADEAGFKVEALGAGDWVIKGGEHDRAFQWKTPHGILQEYRGKLALLEAESGEQIYPGLIHVGMRND